MSGPGGEQLPTVPDDASALEPDRLLWLAEEQARQRRARFRRLVFTRRWDRFGLSGPLVTLSLLATSLVAALAVAFTPRGDPFPGPGTLSSAPQLTTPSALARPTPAPTSELLGRGAVTPVVGRRLPAVTLTGEAGEPLPSQEIRPAVIALVPPGCDCSRTLGEAVRQAQEFRLRLWLLGSGTADGVEEQLVDLTRASAGGLARWAVDVTGTVHSAVLARGLTLVLIADDGRILQVLRDVPPGGNLVAMEPQLALLASDRRGSGTG